jgi:hypothetical protein
MILKKGQVLFWDIYIAVELFAFYDVVYYDIHF